MFPIFSVFNINGCPLTKHSGKTNQNMPENMPKNKKNKIRGLIFFALTASLVDMTGARADNLIHEPGIALYYQFDFGGKPVSATSQKLGFRIDRLSIDAAPPRFDPALHPNAANVINMPYLDAHFSLRGDLVELIVNGYNYSRYDLQRVSDETEVNDAPVQQNGLQSEESISVETSEEKAAVGTTEEEAGADPSPEEPITEPSEEAGARELLKVSDLINQQSFGLFLGAAIGIFAFADP